MRGNLQALLHDMIGSVADTVSTRHHPLLRKHGKRASDVHDRCVVGLCLWRLGRIHEAEQVFGRMLWLNPADNQGARFLIEDVRAKMTWEESTRAAT